MKRCINCKYAVKIGAWECSYGIIYKKIPHPLIMGKKCECYEKCARFRFEYPKKK